jgi:hypothetical protein
MLRRRVHQPDCHGARRSPTYGCGIKKAVEDLPGFLMLATPRNPHARSCDRRRTFLAAGACGGGVGRLAERNIHHVSVM